MTHISPAELRALFGDTVPMAAIELIMSDTSDDRTIDDIRSELRSLAAQIKEADKA